MCAAACDLCKCVCCSDAKTNVGKGLINAKACYVPFLILIQPSKVNSAASLTLQMFQTSQCRCLCVKVSPHLFQRSSSSPPQPQNALGKPLIILNCFTVRPLTPPKNSLYGSLVETIIYYYIVILSVLSLQ